MRKPIKLNSTTGMIHSSFGNIHIVKGPQPDWQETDPTQPDYIKNKEEAEQYRPVSIDGQEVLSSDRESGELNLISGENVSITKTEEGIVISAEGGGGTGGGDGTTFVEGDGIDLSGEGAEKTISIQADENDFEFVNGSLKIAEGAIDGDEIGSVSIDKIVPKEGFTLILNGGNANG